MHVLVIGGGVIGLTTAYQLVREGATVTLLDARAAGLGATNVNAGWVVPAEAAPVPGPGMILMSMKWMMRRDSPLYIRPSVKPSFISYMWGMWQACNADAQRAGFAAHLALAEGTVEVFDEYQADGIDFEMHDDGLLMAFTGHQDLENHLAHLELVKQYGLEPTTLMGDDVRAHEPLLSDAVIGGLYFPKERHLLPGQLAQGLSKRLKELGVTVVENAPVLRVDIVGDNVHTVHAGGQKITADKVVLAAGAWSGEVSKQFGYRLPVRPGKGYCIEVEPFGLRGATNLWDAHVAVTPFDNALRIAGTMEFGGLDERVNQVRVDAILHAPAKYLRGWEPPKVAPQAKAGMRPMTPDGLPILGRLGSLKNTYVSTGHGMLGVTLAPGSAAVMADLVVNDKISPLLAPFDPARYRGGR
jgi:D-amino-acid dehydrogenase